MTGWDRPDDSPFDEEPEDRKSEGLDSGRKFIWKGMTTTELMRHMSDIKKCLPPTKIEDVNVEEMLLLQLAVLHELQTSVVGEEKVSVQHKVQAANAVTKGISDLADRQIEMYSSERVKRLETALIRTCRDHMSEDACAAFLASYETLASKVGA